ncbi:MAG: flagellar export protein FliJ [Vicinamibacteraceae bacterium]
MATFIFRPQPALDLRRREEDAAQLLVAEARVISERSAQAHAAAQAAFDGGTARATALDTAGGSITDMIWHRNWIRSLRRELVRTEANAEDRRVQLEVTEQALVAAREKVKALERLKERALEAHRERERREEQKAMDELATLRFAIAQRRES